ncbi:Ubiquinone biosynthesis protein COQ7 [Balamuthia mandrillaris]
MEEFIENHLSTEKQHLEWMEALVPPWERTRLVPLWKVAGWSLGATPTILGGPNALFLTIHAVESFVEEHYSRQLKALEGEHEQRALRLLLQRACKEEVHHKEQALALASTNPSSVWAPEWVCRLWHLTVTVGSGAAVRLAKRF